jgi:hypothetical protein
MIVQGLRFKKSSRSEQNGHCVEIALFGRGAAVRDSKNATGPMLQFGDAVLAPLVGKVKAGSLNIAN